jgi:hypothetical protein
MIHVFLRSLVLLIPVGLMACVEVPLPGAPAPIENACGAAELQDLVGRDAAVLQTMRFGQTVRIIRPGMAVTADYSAERLNIEIDGRETIVRVSCY